MSGSSQGALQATVQRLAPHDHACLIYDTPEEQFAAIAPYLKAGLARNERFFYAVDDNTAAQVLDALRGAGIDVDAALADGRLVLATKRETYVRGGTFDPDAMISFLGEAEREAAEAGFHSVRITGEMTWALAGEPGADRLLEYEAKLNGFFPDANASAICQYNAGRFSAETIEQVIQAHPIVIYGGLVCKNAYYVPPDELLRESRPEQRVQRLLKNIVDRERAEEDIRELNATLEQRVLERTRQLAVANHDLERFLSMVSHDVRAPLRGAAFYLQMLREEYGERVPAGAQEYLAGAERENARASRLVNSFLDLARADQGTLARERVDLSRIAHEILDQLQREHPLRQVEAHVQPGALATGDEHLLRTVLENLLGNAWKYTERQARARIELSWTDAPEGRVFRVRDDGAGFPAELAGTLFQPFRRLHGGEFSGSGVGLATVRRIVERHGGRVWAEGHPSEGATLSFSLPQAPAAPPR